GCLPRVLPAAKDAAENPRLAHPRRPHGAARIPQGRSASAHPAGAQDERAGGYRRDRAGRLPVGEDLGEPAAATYPDLPEEHDVTPPFHSIDRLTRRFLFVALALTAVLAIGTAGF